MAYIWYILGAIATSLAVGVLIWVYIRDRRYERSKTSQVMSDALRQDIEQERDEALARREHFKQALEEASKKSEHAP